MKYDSYIVGRFILVLGILALTACSQVNGKPSSEESMPMATAGLPPTATNVPPTSTPVPVVPSPSSVPSSTPSVQQSVMLLSIHMTTATDGWAVGQVASGRIVLRTRDGGVHWQNVSPQVAPASITSTHFAGSSDAWLAASAPRRQGSARFRPPQSRRLRRGPPSSSRVERQ